MNRRSVFALALLSATLGVAALAAPQDPPPPPPADPPPSTVPMAGFWPTETMVERILDRMSEEMAKHYDFDDEQMLRARELFDRFPAWMNENRGEIQALTNEYLEALLNREPPTPDQVAKWSQRVLPLVNSFSELATNVTGEMSNFMTDDQRVLLEGEMAAFQTGVTVVNNKLGVWADGGYDPEIEWIATKEQREEMRRQDIDRARAMQAAKHERINELGGTTLNPDGESPPGTALGDGRARPNRDAALARNRSLNTDEWARYTEEFITRYKLDANQSELARQKLKSAAAERDVFKQRIAADLERAEKKAKEAKTDEEKKAAQADLKKVRGGLDRRFEDFKKALDKIPTSKQRREAALAEARADAARKPPVAAKPAEAARAAAEEQPTSAPDEKPAEPDAKPAPQPEAPPE